MRNKFVYSCSIKICALGFNKLLESIFCLLLVVETFSLQSCRDVWRQEIRWIWRMRQNHIAQLVQLLKHWSWDMQSGLSGRIIGPFLLTNASCRHCSFWCISLICWTLLLKCNGFAGIRKAAVNQTRSRPPNSDHDLFWVQVWLWEVFWSFFLVQPLSWSSLVVI